MGFIKSRLGNPRNERSTFLNDSDVLSEYTRLPIQEKEITPQKGEEKEALKIPKRRRLLAILC